MRSGRHGGRIGPGDHGRIRLARGLRGRTLRITAATACTTTGPTVTPSMRANGRSSRPAANRGGGRSRATGRLRPIPGR